MPSTKGSFTSSAPDEMDDLDPVALAERGRAVLGARHDGAVQLDRDAPRPRPGATTRSATVASASSVRGSSFTMTCTDGRTIAAGPRADNRRARGPGHALSPTWP